MNHLPTPAPKPPKDLFLALLARGLKLENILSDSEDLKPFECDALSAYRTMPWLAVIPETVEEVRYVLKLCHDCAVPAVARGAGTGLSGGALPAADGVLVSMTKFTRILAVDPDNRLARVQPGVRNLAVSEAAAPYGLFYAPDPSSQIACTIGGNVAENSGGVHCLKYGLTVHNLLGLKFVTAAGDLIELGCSALDGAGYDLMALFTGSEGLLGIVVEVTLRLLPMPAAAATLLAVFGAVEEAGAAVAAVIGAGLTPAGLEMMDRPAIQASEAFIKAGYPTEAAALILCEFDGVDEQVRHDLEIARKLFIDAGAAEVRHARSESERRLFWAGRKATFPAIGRITPDYYCMDGTIPRKCLARVLKEIGELAKAFGLGVANVFHAGDGNLHPLILYDAGKPGDLAKAEALGGKILELCLAVGGTISGEHGVGAEKINQMCIQFAEAELIQFQAVKAAFDPQGLLNPGKAIPTLRRCAEFGGLHVHRGRLPFPELERF